MPWNNRDFERYSSKVKVEVKSVAGTDTKVYDINPYTFDWAPLGTFSFRSGDYIRIIADDPDYPVPADAVLLVPAAEKEQGQ